MPAPLLTRRAGLRALVLGTPALLLAACTSPEAPPVPSGSPDGSPGPAPVGLAAEVAAEEAGLIALYDAALASADEPGEELALLLTSLRDQHAAHRDALGGAPDAPVPGTTPALGALVAAERQAARDRIRACSEAEDPSLARLLALVAASEAAHVPALRAARA